MSGGTSGQCKPNTEGGTASCMQDFVYQFLEQGILVLP